MGSRLRITNNGFQITHTSVRCGYKLEVPLNSSSSGSIICYYDSQNSGKHFTYYYPLIAKDIIKDINEWPDEETDRVRSRWVSSTGASVPVEFGVSVLRAYGYILQPFRLGIL